LDKEELGRSTWDFLHTMAAYYPDKPSCKQQRTMKKFLSSFSEYVVLFSHILFLMLAEFTRVIIAHLISGRG
jgi:hypothetical protein